jgi:hypothetical protein
MPIFGSKDLNKLLAARILSEPLLDFIRGLKAVEIQLTREHNELNMQIP